MPPVPPGDRRPAGPVYGPPPGYRPPPGYGPPPGYRPPQGYGPPPGYAAPYSAPFGAPPPPGVARPGIIPLRPLTLTDIFNGAVGYIRANPKATLGLTTMVEVVILLLSLLAAIGPLAAVSRIESGDLEPSLAAVSTSIASLGSAALVNWLGSVVLSGMLTVVVGRAVFAAPITIGEAWGKVRGRLPALIGLALLELTGFVVVAGLVVVILVGVRTAANTVAVVLIGFPLLLVAAAGLAYAYTVLLFAPILIVLERLPVLDAIERSFALVRHSFWRVFGINLLAAVVVAVVGGAISAPFNIAGQIMLMATSSTAVLLAGSAVSSIGAAISQIITTPFLAGVVVLLYTDRRMRSEAFDLTLQTGAARSATAAEATDHLWLTRAV
ncbi:hypothetical protein [Mycobacterium sp.]|uniref:hypothetical protein n=1 Tax=Mycobacterium sp. TaxID=1785 RepID=UPI003A872589